MSSGEPPLGSDAAKPSRPRKDHNPAWWALIGALSGSLVSGGFSLATAQITNEANDRAALRAQQASEKALEAQRRQGHEQFLREKRVEVFQQFLADSQIVETAQRDYLVIISAPNLYPAGTADSYYSDLTVKFRQFQISGWGVEFFAPAETKVAANDLTNEIVSLYNLLLDYGGEQTEIEPLTEKMLARLDQVAFLRLAFTSAARGSVTS